VHLDGREVLDLLAVGSPDDLLYLHDLRELLLDEVAAPVPVEDGYDPLLPAEVDNCLRYARAFHGDDVLDASPEEEDDVCPAFHDVDAVCGVNARPCGEVLDAEVHDARPLCGLLDVLEEVLSLARGPRAPLLHDVLGAVGDLCPLGCPHVLYPFEDDPRGARPYLVDALDSGGDERRGADVSRHRDQDRPPRLVVLGL
jgi:hypothetical protein